MPPVSFPPFRLEDDELDQIVYDPRDPARATTVDHLPASPRVAANGSVTADPGFLYHLLVLPFGHVRLRGDDHRDRGRRARVAVAAVASLQRLAAG